MASGSADGVCPSCGEKVGQRATWCMHCGEDLPDRGRGDDARSGEKWSGDDARDVDEGGESLLTRLRPGSTTEAERSRGTGIEGSRRSGDADQGEAVESTLTPLDTDARETDAGQTGRDVESDRWHDDATDDSSSWLDTAVRIRQFVYAYPLHALGLVVPILVAAVLVNVALSVHTTGAIAAVAAWAALTGVLARYGTPSETANLSIVAALLNLVFVPMGFSLVGGGGSGQILLAGVLLLFPLLFGVYAIHSAVPQLGRG